MWQGSKFQLDQWSVTTITVSGPVELSFVLVHWTSNFYEKCQAISRYFSSHTPERKKTSLFLWPVPTSTSMSKGLQLRKKSQFSTLPFTA